MLNKLRAQFPRLEGPLLTGLSPFTLRGEVIGWIVRIGRQGILFQRDFWASTHCGMEAAFRAASAYRDEVDRDYPRLSSAERCTTLRANNTSGIPGVSRQMVEGRPYWVAEVGVRGYKKARRFSIRKYGDERARNLAIEARRALLAHVQTLQERRAERSPLESAQPENLPLARAALRGFPWPNPHVHRASGVLGVRLMRAEHVRKDGTVSVAEHWMASMKVAERTYRACFSVKRFGNEEAMRLAIEQRRAWEAEYRKPRR
ncbi:MAG: AP2 domain-containing protein [Rhodocyclales bacterium]|nr:AP2 domain-containing protein [Rhodocyclales bacterium]